MDKAKKEKINVGEADFLEANNREICLEWAKEFIESDRTLSEEIADIKESMEMESVWHSVENNKEDKKMRWNNLTDFTAYLLWLKSLEYQELIETTSSEKPMKRCIVQIQYHKKDSFYSIENNVATVYGIANAYHHKIKDKLGRKKLDKILMSFSEAMYIPERAYEYAVRAMPANNTIRAALKFDLDNGMLSVCDNKKGKWRTYDLDTVSMAVLAAEQPDYSTDKERQMDFKAALRGKALSEADIQNRIKEVNGKWVEQKNERILYAAYGRFLSIGLMRQCCPYARLVGTGEIKGHELEFRGDEYGAEATLIKNEKSAVPVAVWRLGGRAKVNLDYCENYPSFFRKTMFPVELHNGETVECMAYVMGKEMGHGIPNDHYCSDVSQGYEDHDFDIDILNKALKKSAKLCRAEERAAKMAQQGELPPPMQDGGIKM